jgi:2-polyprenyl-3-methyl-5-hydroxy-6-metoxy-1,4-benzoquinol methylase
VRRFFREYHAFLSAEEKSSDVLTRLDARYHAIIEYGQASIAGANILDIGSHNGRWTLAALRSGANHVIGVEPRRELVDAAERHMRRYDIPSNQYRFVVDDIHDQIRCFRPRQFDTILCLGFFYHTTQHFYLLDQFERLSPRCLILDTAINNSPDYKVVVVREPTDNRLMAVGRSSSAWVGRLSGRLLEDALNYSGFDVEYFDWAGFLQNLEEPCPGASNSRYGDGSRVTIHARRRERA